MHTWPLRFRCAARAAPTVARGRLMELETKPMRMVLSTSGRATDRRVLDTQTQGRIPHPGTVQEVESRSAAQAVWVLIFSNPWILFSEGHIVTWVASMLSSLGRSVRSVAQWRGLRIRFSTRICT
jgi:hypothetical protein